MSANQPRQGTKPVPKAVAQAWADSLMNATLLSNNGTVASAVKQRLLPRLTINGIATQSPVALSSYFSFENYDPLNDQQTLNLAEVTLVGQEEEAIFRNALCKSGTIIKTATVENPWQDTNLSTKLLKVYVQATMSPFDFADLMYLGLDEIFRQVL